jgi:hypothetical protein
MIKILVGEEERVFLVHKSALIARSQFFKTAMGGKWQEAQDGVVKLPDDDGDTFALYEQLVYTGKVPAFDDSEETERKVVRVTGEAGSIAFQIIANLNGNSSPASTYLPRSSRILQQKTRQSMR